jgi:hypothetical protein
VRIREPIVGGLRPPGLCACPVLREGLMPSLPVLFALLPAACVVQDSPLSSLDALPTREVRPDLTIGSLNHPHLAFSRIGDLSVGPDGNLYVLEAMDVQIVVVDPTGQFVGRIGRRGAGPGEFRSPAGIGWIGDTLWVMDAGARRVTYFLGSEVVRTEAYPAVPMGPGENLAALYPLAKGEYLGVLANTPSTGDPAGMRPFPLLRIDAAGVVKDTLALLRESYPLRIRIATTTGYISTSPLVHDFPLHRVSRDGDRVVVLDRPIAEGNLNRATITWVRSSGDTIRVRHLTSRPVPITDRQWEARVEERFQSASRSRLSRQDYLRALRRPPSFPPASGFVIARDGRYWLAREDILGEAERRWVALDGEGKPLFEVRLPRRFQLHEAMENALWGVMLDDLGVPWIHRYSIL